MAKMDIATAQRVAEDAWQEQRRLVAQLATADESERKRLLEEINRLVAVRVEAENTWLFAPLDRKTSKEGA